MYDGEGLLIKKFNSYDELRNDEAGFADYLKKSNAWEQANKVEYEEQQEELERQQDRDEQRAEREEDQRDQRKQARSEKQKSYNNDFSNVDNNDRKEQRQIHDKPRSRTSDKRKSNKAKEEVKIPIEEQMKTRERELENKGTLTQNEVLELEYIQDELANWMAKNHQTVRHFSTQENQWLDFNWKGDIVNRDRSVRHARKQYCTCKQNEVCKTCWAFHQARLRKLNIIGRDCKLPIEQQTEKLEKYVKTHKLEKKVIIKPKLLDGKNVAYIERHYVPGEKRKNSGDYKDDAAPWEDPEYAIKKKDDVERHGVNSSAPIMKQRSPREHPEILITKSKIGNYESGTQILVFNTTSDKMFTAAHWIHMSVGKLLKR